MNEHVKIEAAQTTKMSPEEWQARVDLAAVYRLCAHYGWDDVIYNHCSMRVPGEPSQVPDEAARALVDRGHRLEPPQGRHERRPRREVGRQPAGLHAARRPAQGPRRHQLRGACPHRDRHGAGGPQGRIEDGVAAGDAVLPAHRLSPLRGHHRGLRRARAHPQGAGPEPRADHVQSRPGHGRQDRARGLHPDEVPDVGGDHPAADGSDRRRDDRGVAGDLREGRGAICDA